MTLPPLARHPPADDALGPGREEDPTAAIYDSRTVQSTPRERRAGYDGYKKRKGGKVHIAVDTLGHLPALKVTPASEEDRAQAGATDRGGAGSHWRESGGDIRRSRLYGGKTRRRGRRRWGTARSGQARGSQARFCAATRAMGNRKVIWPGRAFSPPGPGLPTAGTHPRRPQLASLRNSAALTLPKSMAGSKFQNTL